MAALVARTSCMIVPLHIDGHEGLDADSPQDNAQTLPLLFRTGSVYGQSYRFFVASIAIIQLYLLPGHYPCGQTKNVLEDKNVLKGMINVLSKGTSF